MIKLTEFEKAVQPEVYIRGAEYFHAGNVISCEIFGPLSYVARVAGTRVYTVRLMIEHGSLHNLECSCPYDNEAVCKHIVAVVFHVQAQEFGSHPMKTSNKPAKMNKQHDAAIEIDAILKKVSAKELKQWVREVCLTDANMRNQLLENFQPQPQIIDKAFYRQMIEGIVDALTDSSGFIGRRRASDIGFAVDDIVKQARVNVQTQNYPAAFPIICAIMEELVPLFHYADDSSGVLSGCVFEAAELLHEIAIQNLDPGLRQNMLDYALDAYRRKIYEGWDWHFEMIELAVKLQPTEAEARMIHGMLTTVAGHDFEVETAQSLALRVLELYADRTEIDAYIKGHLKNPEIRKRAIETAIENRELDKAEKLAKAGIKRNEKRYPGLLKDWYTYLQSIAKIRGDKAQLIEINKVLFLGSYEDLNKAYTALKRSVPKSEWSSFVQIMLTALRGKTEFGDSPHLLHVYVAEKMWPELFQHISKFPHLRTIEQYAPKLKADFQAEVATLYSDAIIEDAQHSLGRAAYKKTCTYIRRLRKFGSQEDVDQVIAVLRAMFPQRPALQDELNKL